MSRRVVLRPESSTRQQPLLKTQSSRVGEVVGGVTAECAAVCCCCPCALANLLVLAIFKVPAGLCRRAMRRKRKRMLPPRRRRCSCGCDDTENQIHATCIIDLSDLQKPQELDKEVQQLEKEMWDRFYSTGFWRSPSQRESAEAMAAAKSRIPVSSTWEIANATCH